VSLFAVGLTSGMVVNASPTVAYDRACIRVTHKMKATGGLVKSSGVNGTSYKVEARYKSSTFPPTYSNWTTGVFETAIRNCTLLQAGTVEWQYRTPAVLRGSAGSVEFRLTLNNHSANKCSNNGSVTNCGPQPMVITRSARLRPQEENACTVADILPVLVIATYCEG